MIALLAKFAVGAVNVLPVIRDILHELNDAWEKARIERAKRRADEGLSADLKAIEDAKKKALGS
jgi:hypothetical protein